MPTQSQNVDYIHGASPEEHSRLDLMNRLINEACLRELSLAGGEQILEVGSGLGQFARAMARAAGRDGTVIGIEREPSQIEQCHRLAREAGEPELVEVRQGDAMELPLKTDEWGSFDLVHARFVLEHVPEPLRVVEQMVAAARPGGRIALADDDHDVMRFWPEPPGVVAAWQAYLRTYDRLGNDPYVGRRLVQLLHQAGATPTRTSSIFYGACAGDARFQGLVINLVEVLRGAREKVIAQGLSDPAYYDAAIAGLSEWSQRPDAALWYGINWAEGTKR